jgi:DNA-binding MarR family transcriptional regulator
LEHPSLSIGVKVIYAMFLRYAWHNNLVFPGQQRLADAIGISVSRVNKFVKELEKAKLVEITRRGQGMSVVHTSIVKLTETTLPVSRQ